MNDHVQNLEHNLAVLTSFGIKYIDLVQGSLFVLKQSCNGDTELDAEQLGRFFEICENALNEHKRLLQMNEDQRLSYTGE